MQEMREQFMGKCQYKNTEKMNYSLEELLTFLDANVKFKYQLYKILWCSIFARDEIHFN